jgi:hypothetical protein
MRIYGTEDQSLRLRFCWTEELARICDGLADYPEGARKGLFPEFDRKEHRRSRSACCLVKAPVSLTRMPGRQANPRAGSGDAGFRGDVVHSQSLAEKVEKMSDQLEMLCGRIANRRFPPQAHAGEFYTIKEVATRVRDKTVRRLQKRGFSEAVAPFEQIPPCEIDRYKRETV